MSTQITILPNGPLKVEGDFTVAKAAGSEVEVKETAYLCRCGRSGSKPFCDGSHAKAGFQAD